jgi:polyisoprenoid-binding protein YceI
MFLRSRARTALVVCWVAACGGGAPAASPAPTPAAPAPASAPAEAHGAAARAPATGASNMRIVAERSKVEFVGSKVTGEHRGSFSGLRGNARIRGDSVELVEVVVDLRSLAIEPAKLQEHLLGPDFFEAERFPEARFDLDSVTPAVEGEATHRVKGRLQIRGVTQPIDFPAKVEFAIGAVHAKAAFEIDRRLFGITYPGAADDLISDKVRLEVELALHPSTEPPATP